MGFIISPWSLLLMPSGSISFTDEYVTQQDLRAFTAPEVLEGASLTSVSDIEKVQTLGVTECWNLYCLMLCIVYMLASLQFTLLSWQITTTFWSVVENKMLLLSYKFSKLIINHCQ